MASSNLNDTRIKVNWLKMAGSVATNGASALFTPFIPVAANSIANSAAAWKDAREARRAVRETTNRQKNAMESSPGNKNAMNLFKSAFDDIDSGTYAIEKTTDSLYSEYNDRTSMSFNMPIGEEALDMTTEQIILRGNQGVAQTLIQTSEAQMKAIQESSRMLINANIKSSKALAGSINNTLNFGFNNIVAAINTTNIKLDRINSNIENMIAFNNSNALQFYSRSLEMMDGIGKMLTNVDDSLYSSRTKNKKYDVSDGIDPKGYLKHVIDGIAGSSIGMMMESFGLGKYKDKMVDWGDKLVPGMGAKGGNPIVSSIVNMILPEKSKKTFENFDKSIMNSFNEIMRRVADGLENSILSNFVDLSDILGNKRNKLSRIDMGRYEKGAMAWNGIAQKALVEVIPELLTSIDSKLGNTDKRYYDYNTGQFRTQTELAKSFDAKYLDNLTFSLREAMEKLEESAKASGRTMQETNRLMSSVDAIIDDRLSDKIDSRSSRVLLSQQAKKHGISEKDFNSFFGEFQEAMENGIDAINDMFHDISSTQSVYRNLNLNMGKGKTVADLMRNRHSARGGTYRSYIGIPNVNDTIAAIQSQEKLTELDLSYDKDLTDMVFPLLMNERPYNEIVELVKSTYASKLRKYKSKDRFANKFSGLDAKITKATSKINEKVQGIAYGDNAYRTNYEDDGSYDNLDLSRYRNADDLIRDLNISAGKRSSKKASVKRSNSSMNIGQSDALSWNTSAQDALVNIIPTLLRSIDSKLAPAPRVGKANVKVRGRATEQSSEAAEQIMSLATSDYNTIMKASASELDRDQNIVNNQLRTINEEEPATTIEDSIVQSNNSVKAAMGTIVGSFQSFGARIFGKDGFLKQLWDSEARKKVTNKIKTKLFTGKDAVFKKQYEAFKSDSKEIGNNTKENIKGGYRTAYHNTMQYMFGEDYENSKEYQDSKFFSKFLNVGKSSSNKPEGESTPDVAKTSENIAEVKEATTKLKNSMNDAVDGVEVAADNLVSSTNAAVETMVGDPNVAPEKKKSSYMSEFRSKMKSSLPKVLAGAAGGLALGALNNQFSLLGSMFLPGGPIAGAIVGGGLSILSQTEAFKTFMFGKTDPNTQKREGGLISSKLRANFKKSLPVIIGAGVLGGVKSLITGALGFDSSLGLFGMQLLPGGILGGAMLGVGAALLKNSETVKSLLFGKKDEDGKRSGTMITRGMDKAKGAFAKYSPALRKGAKGLGIGALSGLVLSNMGYIPAMLSAGGPVGMGLVGLGLGIASTSTKFNEWMFGSKSVDKDGNITRNKDGLLTRVTNILMTNVIHPISTEFRTKLDDTMDWVKTAITFPFRLAVGPIMDNFKEIIASITATIKDTLGSLANGIMTMLRNSMKSLFSPVTKVIGFIGKSVIGAAQSQVKMLLAPAMIGANALQFLTAGTRRKEYADFYKSYYAKGNINERLKQKWALEEEETGKKKVFTQRLADRISAYTGHGEIADAAREGWNNEHVLNGGNSMGWRNVSKERRELKEAREARLKEESKWRKIDKYASRIINKDLGGREVTLSDHRFDKYRKRFMDLKVDGEMLQSSDDIMDLLYRRSDFKKRLKGSINSEEGTGVTINETPEQKAAREKTEAYQQKTIDFYSSISDQFSKLADALIFEKNLQSETDGWVKDKARLKRRMKHNKSNNVDVDAPELQDWDIGELSSDDLDDYKLSEFFDSGDLIGFMRSRGMKPRSEDRSSTNQPEESTSKAPFKLRRVSGYSGSRSKREPSPIEKEIQTSNQLLGAVLEASTGGAITAEDVKEKRGDSFGKRIMNKFNITQNESLSNLKTTFTGFFNKNKKEDAEAARDAKEQKESDTAREGTDSLLTSLNQPEEDDGDTIIVDGDEEEKSLLSKILDGVKSFGGAVAGSTVGGALLTAIKGIAALWTAGGAVLGIAEFLNSGTTDKIIAKLDEVNEFLQQDDLLETYVAPKLEEIGIKIGDGIVGAADWFSDHFPVIAEDFIIPGIEKSADFIVKNVAALTNIATTVVTSLAPAIGEAIVYAVPQIATTIGEMVWNATGGELLGYKLGIDDTKQTAEGIKHLSETEQQKAMQEMQTQGYTEVYNPETGKVEKIYGTPVVDENGDPVLDGSGNVMYEYNTEQVMNSGMRDALGNTVTRSFLQRNAGGATGAAARAGSKAVSAVGGGLINSVIKSVSGAASGLTSGNIFTALPKAIYGGVTGSIKGAYSGVKAGWDLDTTIAKASTKAKSMIDNAKFYAAYGWDAVTSSKAGTTIAEEASNIAQAATSLKSKADDILTAQKKQITDFFNELFTRLKSVMNDSSLVKIIDKYTSGNTKLSAFIEPLITKFEGIKTAILKNADKVKKAAVYLTKMAPELVGKLSPVTIAFTVYDVVNGAYNAENLFMVPDGEADYLMRCISALFQGLLGTMVGVFFDIGLELANIVFGVDYKHEFAMTVYLAIAPTTNQWGLVGKEGILELQDDLVSETDAYNQENNTNLTVQEYNDKVNRTVLQDVGAGVSAAGKWVADKATHVGDFAAFLATGEVTHRPTEQQEATQAAIETRARELLEGGTLEPGSWQEQSMLDILNEGSEGANYRMTADGQLRSGASGGFGPGDGQGPTSISSSKSVTSYLAMIAGNTNAILNHLTGSQYSKDVPTAVGFGSGLYEQGNSKWANMQIGNFSSGAPARMKDAGCGPTAMAAVVNSLNGKPIGYGKTVTPADMGAYAAANGYISQGGANAGLFTQGAARMGLSARPVTNSRSLEGNLRLGRPTILTGTSGSSSTPYTKAGHIVVADRMDGNKASVMDPITGRRKSYAISDISKNTNSAWSYSKGYGLGNNTLSILSVPNSTTGFSSDLFQLPSLTETIEETKARQQASTGVSGFASGIISGVADKVNDGIGLLNSALTLGYATNDNGIDLRIYNANLTHFMNTDKVYKAMSPVKWNSATTNRAYTGRVASQRISILGAILTTQYFSGPSTIGGVKITTASADAKLSSGTFTSNYLDKCFAAAMAKESAKSGKVVSALSPLEKVLAALSYTRVVYGFNKAYNYFVSDTGVLDKISKHGSSSSTTETMSYSEGASIMSNTGSTGVNSLSDLAALAANKTFFGKMKLIGMVVEAQVNAFINGTDFWTEFNALSNQGVQEASAASGGAIASLTGVGGNLDNMINDPQNIQEEMMGITASLVYPRESGGRYDAINANDVGQFSVGTYQARGGNANILLSAIANAPGIGSSAQATLREYATWAANGKGGLNESQVAELRDALNAHPDITKEVMDNEAMRYWQDNVFKNYLSKWYDTDVLKDLRTLPMLASISGAGPGFIVNTGTTGAFKNMWVPTTKAKELAAARDTLTAPGAKLASYAGYINSDYEFMKDYNFIHNTPQGELSRWFAADTNPLGFGKLKLRLGKPEDTEAQENPGSDVNRLPVIDKTVPPLTVPSLRDGKLHIIPPIGFGNTPLASKASTWLSNMASNSNSKAENWVKENGNTTSTTTLPTYATSDSGGDGYTYTPGEIVDGSSTTEGDTEVDTESTNGFAQFRDKYTSMVDSIVAYFADTYGIDIPSLGEAAEGIVTSATNMLTSGASGIIDSNIGDVNITRADGAGRDGPVGDVTGNDVSRLISVAKSQIGYKEKYNASNLKDFDANVGSGADDYTKYNQEMWNANGYKWQWCNTFVSWVAQAAGIPPETILRSAGCANTTNWFANQDRFIYRQQVLDGEATPQTGDLILFGSGGGSHIGFVYHMNEDGSVQTIEGNPSVREERQPLTDYVYGFARPDYSNNVKTVNVEDNLPRLGYGNGIKINPVSSNQILKNNNPPNTQADKRRINAYVNPSSKVNRLPVITSDKKPLGFGRIRVIPLGYGDPGYTPIGDVTGNDAERVLKIAQSQYGYHEKGNENDLRSFAANGEAHNYTKYNKEMWEVNGEDWQWCNTFVSWAGQAAGVPASIYPRGAGCTATMKEYRDRGQFINRGEGMPQRGDLVYFCENDEYRQATPQATTISTHIGFVEGVDSGGRIIALEGNKYQKVSRVYRPIDQNIIGFARPAYNSAVKTVNAESNLPVLGYGSPTQSNYRLKSGFDRELSRTNIYKDPGYIENIRSSGPLGYGLNVNTTVDSSSTDEKLEKIFALVADWYTSSKAAQSSATQNVNVTNTTNNIKSNGKTTTTTKSSVNTTKFRDRIAKDHSLLASRSMVN